MIAERAEITAVAQQRGVRETARRTVARRPRPYTMPRRHDHHAARTTTPHNTTGTRKRTRGQYPKLPLDAGLFPCFVDPAQSWQHDANEDTNGLPAP
ncbi:hypothetical protein T261_00007 [Streptomyces lydicus]|nr:hypothetical protein T261_00007 [Streptomyces lydicus]